MTPATVEPELFPLCAGAWSPFPSPNGEPLDKSEGCADDELDFPFDLAEDVGVVGGSVVVRMIV
jgi:hypothetical protein